MSGRARAPIRPEDRFTLWAEQVERMLLRVVIVTLVALVIVQALLADDSVRVFFSYVDQLEGTPLPGTVTGEEGRSSHYLTVLLTSMPEAPQAALLVNGRATAFFNSPRVTVAVRPGDLLEIDAAAYSGQVRFRLVGASPGVLYPPLGREIVTEGTVEMLGHVVLRQKRNGWAP